MRRSTAQTKKETNGLTESQLYNRLAEQQHLANQLALHQIRYRSIGYLILIIASWVQVYG